MGEAKRRGNYEARQAEAKANRAADVIRREARLLEAKRYHAALVYGRAQTGEVAAQPRKRRLAKVLAAAMLAFALGATCR